MSKSARSIFVFGLDFVKPILILIGVVDFLGAIRTGVALRATKMAH